MKTLSFLILSLILTSTPSHAAVSAETETVYDENAAIDYSLLEIGSALDADATEPTFSSRAEDPSRARLVAIINKSPMGSTSQVMKVYLDGTLIQEWDVSTGREKLETAKSGKVYRTTTPVGYFRPSKIELNHYSNTWKADMPHAVFFNGGIAVHATTHIEDLGKRASGGCVRLAPENAKKFYQLVKSVGFNLVPKIDRNGKTALDQQGNPVMTKNWDVLIIVENRI